jgi:hypothetical protein
MLLDNENNIWIATLGGGISVLDKDSVVSGISDRQFQEFDFKLGQNYPNPFNNSTIINYQLSVANDVKLVIYDLLGREVKTLVDQFQNAGTYSIQFDASGLASGIYNYVLSTGDRRESRRMLLLK